MDAYEPILRAIATSGYTGENQSRMAAFLTSDSATELVQQMTTLDMIAVHTNEIIAEVSVLQDAAEVAEAEAADAPPRPPSRHWPSSRASRPRCRSGSTSTRPTSRD